MCDSLAEVRVRIDEIDQQMIELLCQREQFVKCAATFKKNAEEVRGADRVAEVIQKVRLLAEQGGGSPDVAEAVYKSMIAAFINLEMKHLKE